MCRFCSFANVRNLTAQQEAILMVVYRMWEIGSQHLYQPDSQRKTTSGMWLYVTSKVEIRGVRSVQWGFLRLDLRRMWTLQLALKWSFGVELWQLPCMWRALYLVYIPRKLSVLWSSTGIVKSIKINKASTVMFRKELLKFGTYVQNLKNPWSMKKIL